jgi:hypothetical protein
VVTAVLGLGQLVRRKPVRRKSRSSGEISDAWKEPFSGIYCGLISGYTAKIVGEVGEKIFLKNKIITDTYL